MTTTESFLFVCLMVFNATFNNISVILWSALLVEKTAQKIVWPFDLQITCIFQSAKFSLILHVFYIVNF
jgi:hypothetical protein